MFIRACDFFFSFFHFLGNKDRERAQYLTERMLKINPPLLLINAERKWNSPLTVTSRSKGEPSFPWDGHNASSAKTSCHFAGINSNSYCVALSPCQQRRHDARAGDETRGGDAPHVAVSADGEAVWMKPGFTRDSDKDGTLVIIRGTEHFVFDWYQLTPKKCRHSAPRLSTNFEYNDQLRAIIHYQSNLVLCLRSLSEAAMTF